MRIRILLKQWFLNTPVFLRYGLLLSFGIIVLKTIEYRLFSFRYSHELYIGLIAIFFLLVGAVAAYAIVGKRPSEVNNDLDLRNALTAAERKILDGLLAGYTNQQLADQNNVSVNTVKSHLKNLYRKLDVKNRAEAVALAKCRTVL